MGSGIHDLSYAKNRPVDTNINRVHPFLPHTILRGINAARVVLERVSHCDDTLHTLASRRDDTGIPNAAGRAAQLVCIQSLAHARART